MIARNVEARIVKLESARQRPDEMLVVWRKPGISIEQALEAVAFAKGDKVICPEWLGKGPAPQPRWYDGRLSRLMGASEYDALMDAVQETASLTGRNRPPSRLLPFPVLAEQRLREIDHARRMICVRSNLDMAPPFTEMVLFEVSGVVRLLSM